MEQNEQWLSDGDCKICRKRNYCTKPCKRNQWKWQRDLNSAFAEAMAKTVVRKRLEIYRRDID